MVLAGRAIGVRLQCREGRFVTTSPYEIRGANHTNGEPHSTRGGSLAGRRYHIWYNGSMAWTVETLNETVDDELAEP